MVNKRIDRLQLTTDSTYFEHFLSVDQTSKIYKFAEENSLKEMQ